MFMTLRLERAVIGGRESRILVNAEAERVADKRERQTEVVLVEDLHSDVEQIVW